MLPDEAIDTQLLREDSFPNASLRAHGGAIADLPDDATAFSHRDTAFKYVAAAASAGPSAGVGAR